MPAQTTNLFLLEDLENVGTASRLAETDLEALQSVATWIRNFVVPPHKDLGRPGAVCPFVPGSLERQALWLAPERIANRSVPEVVKLVSGYKRLLANTRPTHGEDATYNVIVVVSPICRLITRKASSTRSYGILRFRRMWKTESCSGRSTKATRGLRSTTRASDHSNRPCRFCS